MKIVNETFTYEVPEDCDDYITVNDYVTAVVEATCPFYDGDDRYLPDIYNTYIVEEIV